MPNLQKKTKQKTGAKLKVLSRSFDNGEVLPRKQRHSGSMEYMVRSFITDIPFEEYIVPSAPVTAPVLPADKKAEDVKPLVTETAPPSNDTATTDAQKLAILDKLNKPAQEAVPATPAQPAQSAQAAPSSSAAKPAAPVQQASFEYLEPESFNSLKPAADDDDFMSDMKAILRGEKVYNNDKKSVEQKNQQADPSRQREIPNALSQMENKQSIFDQIAESMSYAKAYDLGNIDLEKRFNDFDKIAESSKKMAAAPVTRFSQPPISSEDFLNDLNSIATRSKTGSPQTPPVNQDDEYYYEAPDLSLSRSNEYSYMQNPALIAGIEVADALQIGLGAVSVGQAQAASSAGGFSLTYDKAHRLLTTEGRALMPGSQTAKRTYSQELLWIGELKKGFADASIVIEWEGNDYGEIGTAVITRDLDNSTDWTKSSCNVNITRIERIPLPGTDPREWPMVYHYEGSFDPAANGKYEFDGEFEINAFGGLRFVKHRVRNRSLVEFMKAGKPEEYVRKGQDTIKPVPQIPEDQLKYLRSKLP